MRMKIKNRSHSYEINSTRLKHGYIYSKYKKCPSMMMLILRSKIKTHTQVRQPKLSRTLIKSQRS